MYWVATLMPMALVMVAIRSMTPTGRSTMSTPSLSVAPIGLAPLHSASADDDRPASRPVIAARVLIDPRSASEFAHPDDRRRVQQPARGQVSDERRHPLIELGQQPPRQCIEVVGMGIPAVQRDLDIGHALLDQTSRHQATRAERASAILVADGRGLLLDVEGILIV